jgi:hypothetical protein
MQYIAYVRQAKHKSLRPEFAEGGPEDDLKKLEQGWPFHTHE